MFEKVFNGGPIGALGRMLAFTQARHRVLTENIANVDTPGYVTRQLDPKGFQQALRKALDAEKETGELRLKGTEEFHETPAGELVVTPTSEPAENILFHDQTNMRIERQMAMLAENAMMHQTATELLRGQFEKLQTAIRGTVR